MQSGDLNAAMKQFTSVEAIADEDPSKDALVHCNRWAAAVLVVMLCISRCLFAAEDLSIFSNGKRPRRTLNMYWQLIPTT